MRLITGLLSFYAVCGIGAIANIGAASYILSTIIPGAFWNFRCRDRAVWNYAATSIFTWRTVS